MFQDRISAGRQLADLMRDENVDLDLVLGIPRGGLPAARMVADAYDVPLDVVAAKKLWAPNNPELAIGAAAADGTVWLNDDLITRLRVDDEYVERERERVKEVAAEKERTYREGRDPPTVEGKRVAIVDDGVATGATMLAALDAVRRAEPRRLIVAVAVAPRNTLNRLRGTADEVICLEVPDIFVAVGQAFREFRPVTDNDVIRILRSAREV